MGSILIIMLLDSAVRLAQGLQNGEDTLDARGLMDLVDKVVKDKMTDAEKILLTSWSEQVQREADSRAFNQSTMQECARVANDATKTYKNSSALMETPAPVEDEHPESCQELSFMEVSGVVFWSLLGLSLVTLLLWKICKK